SGSTASHSIADQRSSRIRRLTALCLSGRFSVTQAMEPPGSPLTACFSRTTVSNMAWEWSIATPDAWGNAPLEVSSYRTLEARQGYADEGGISMPPPASQTADALSVRRAEFLQPSE